MSKILIDEATVTLALELLAVATFIAPKLQAKRTDVINAGLKALAEQPAQQEPVPCCGKYKTCTQACTPRGRFLGKREALAEQPQCKYPNCPYPCMDLPDCKEAEQPTQQEPFGYFQYDIRLDAWVQNRINNKGAAFYTAGDIRALKHRIHDQDLMLERQTARIVDLQTHIENLEGEDR